MATPTRVKYPAPWGGQIQYHIKHAPLLAAGYLTKEFLRKNDIFLREEKKKKKKFRFRVYIECKPNLKCNQEVRKNEWIAVYQDAVQYFRNSSC